MGVPRAVLPGAREGRRLRGLRLRGGLRRRGGLCRGEAAAGRMGRRILLFGLSADPPLGDAGHGGLVSYFAESGVFSEVWVLPVFEHIFAHKAARLAPFHLRMRMAHLTFAHRSTPECSVRVKATERDVFRQHMELLAQQRGGADRGAYADADADAAAMTTTPGTIDLLKYLRAEEKMCQCANDAVVDADDDDDTSEDGGNASDCEFTFVLGSDTYRDLLAGRWKTGPEELLRYTNLAVVYRPGTGTEPAVFQRAMRTARKPSDAMVFAWWWPSAISWWWGKLKVQMRLGSAAKGSVGEGEEQNEQLRRYENDERVSFHIVPQARNVSSTLVRRTWFAPRLLDLVEPPVLEFMRRENLYQFTEARVRRRRMRIFYTAMCVVSLIANSWSRNRRPPS